MILILENTEENSKLLMSYNYIVPLYKESRINLAVWLLEPRRIVRGIGDKDTLTNQAITQTEIKILLTKAHILRTIGLPESEILALMEPSNE